MTATSTVAVLGEAIVDLVASPRDGSFRAHPGGSPFTVAIGLSRLGHRSVLLARISADGFGGRLRRHAADNGVDLSRVVTATGQTTLAVASLDDSGGADYAFYGGNTGPDWQWTHQELADLPPGVRVLHFGSLASWTPPGADAVADLARRVRAAGDVLVSYDPNIRPGLLGDRDTARTTVEDRVRSAHVVKASDEDLRWLYPDLEPVDAAHHWTTLGPELVVVTHGAHGVEAVTDRGVHVRCAAKPVALADTVGAGDAFMAGLLDALVRRGSAAPGQVRELDFVPLSRILDDAAHVAALTCEQPGADPPTREAVFARRLGLPTEGRATA